MAIFTGTTGDDSILGTPGDDDFHMEDGGDDTVDGSDGRDVFYFGDSFTSADRVEGGRGRDILVLDGDYSSGVEISPADVSGVETVLLMAGHDYVLDVVGNSPALGIDGSALGVGDQLVVHGSLSSASVEAEGGDGDDLLTGSAFIDFLNGHAGDNTIKGAAGDDHLSSSGDAGAVLKGGGGDDLLVLTGFDKVDHIVGGPGVDVLQLDGGTDGLVKLRPYNLKTVESLQLGSGDFAFVLNDANVAAGATLRVGLHNSGMLYFDGSAETNGALELSGASNNDTLIGGRGDDTLFGGGGHDILVGGDGDDALFTTSFGGNSTVTGGLGADTISADHGLIEIVYTAVADSTPDGFDTIEAFNKSDTIELSAIDADTTLDGDQAFHVVASLSGHAGELALLYDEVRKETTVVGDVDGDGQADFQVLIEGHAVANHFVL